MNVLVACEYSGRVRDAFLAKGHRAYSCDLEPTFSDPLRHYMGDVRDILYGEWDLLIAHPPCTYLTNAGARWFYHPEDRHLAAADRRPHPQYPTRWADRDEAIAFFKMLQDAPIPLKCIENSQPSKYAMDRIGRYTQKVHPHHFGENYSKGACLWLEGLEPLVPTHTRDDYDEPPRQQCWNESPGPDRWKRRATTYQSIATAFAAQWG